MGTTCPICKTHQPFKRHLTRNQESARKATDVIGHVLGCDHKVGGKKFTAYQEAIQKLETDKSLQIMEIEKDFSDELSAAWEKISASTVKEEAD